MIKNIVKYYQEGEYVKCIKASKEQKGNSDELFIGLYYRVLANEKLKGKKYLQIIERAVSLYPSNSFYKCLLALWILDNLENEKQKSGVYRLINESNSINKSISFNYLIILSFNINNAKKFMKYFKQFIKHCTPSAFYSFEDTQEALNFFDICMKMGIRNKQQQLVIDFYQNHLNTIDKEIFPDLADKIEERLDYYYNNNTYVRDKQYWKKYLSAKYKLEIEDYSGALADIQISYDKCENYDMESYDLTRINNLMIEIKLKLKDYEFFREGYEENIKYLQDNFFEHLKYGNYFKICERFPEAIDVYLRCLEYFSKFSDEDFIEYLIEKEEQKVFYYTITKPGFIQELNLLIAKCYVELNDFEKAKEFLDYRLPKDFAFLEEDEYFSTLKKVLINNFNNLSN
jgi:hypothetical protein